MSLREIIAVFYAAIDVISNTFERISWLMFQTFWAFVIAIFVSVAFYAPGPVPWFYRYAISVMILFAGGAIGFFALQLLRPSGSAQ